MIFINLNDIAILNINGADYRCIINGISTSDVVNLLQKTDLTERKRSTIRIKKYIQKIYCYI